MYYAIHLDGFFFHAIVLFLVFFNFNFYIVHAFPPDIGQGVNAGLEDVLALRQALIGNTADVSIGKALKEYERNRSPQVNSDHRQYLVLLYI